MGYPTLQEAFLSMKTHEIDDDRTRTGDSSWAREKELRLV